MFKINRTLPATLEDRESGGQIVDPPAQVPDAKNTIREDATEVPYLTFADGYVRAGTMSPLSLTELYMSWLPDDVKCKYNLQPDFSWQAQVEDSVCVSSSMSALCAVSRSEPSPVRFC